MGATDTGDDLVAGEINQSQNETIVQATFSRDARYHGSAVLVVENLPHGLVTLGDTDADVLSTRAIDGVKASGYRFGSGVVADASLGAGVAGMSGTDGIRGVADDRFSAALWNPTGADPTTLPAEALPTGPLVGVRGVSNGSRPNSVGVVGTADAAAAKGVVGNSVAGVGVMGVSTRGIGVWGESTIQPGGVFSAGTRGAPVAQLRLVPVPRGPHVLPSGGQAGDLLVMRAGGDSNQIELWLCIDHESDAPRAAWAQIAVGPPVVAP